MDPPTRAAHLAARVEALTLELEHRIRQLDHERAVLHGERAANARRIEALDAAVRDAETRAGDAERRLASLASSRTFRYTAPLRGVVRALVRTRHGRS